MTDPLDYAQVAVVIPALNEEKSLPLVLADLPAELLAAGTVIVADNGSTDSTAACARAAGALVVHQPQRGYGAACLAGLRLLEQRIARSEQLPPQVVAFLDADYSDHPQEIDLLLTPLFTDQADLVIGSRVRGQREPGALPPQSRWGNLLACTLMRLFFGVRYTDLGPFRAIRYPVLQSLVMEDEGFGWTIEMQIKAAKAGLRSVEVPVSYRRRIGVSKITGTLKGAVSAGVIILYTIGKHGFRFRKKRSTSIPAQTTEAIAPPHEEPQ